MKNCICILRFANGTAGLVCLLVFAMLAAGSWQVGAQAPVAADGNSTSSVGQVTLAGHMASRVLDGTAIRVSHYDPAQKLRLALAVMPPHMAEEEEFIRELETRSSPNFHKFLTLDEWNARFAPSAEDEQKVVDWARSQGLTVTNRFANRLLVDVEAPAGTIEKAFGVTLNNYRVDDEVDFANDRDPVVPASLSGILYSVLGLESIDRMHGNMSETRNAKGPDYSPGPAYTEGESSHGDGDPNKNAAHVRAALASGQPTPRPSFTNGYIDPGDIFSSQAYNWDGLELFSHCCNVHNDSGGSPAISSIALATFAGFSSSDVDTFFTTYGFAWNWTPYRIDGTSGVPGTECTIGVTAGCDTVTIDDEATLDLEYSTAAANSYGSSLSTAHVYVYESANQLYNTWTDMFNFMLNDDNARVMSTSWSATESTSGDGYTLWEAPLHAIFNNMTGVGWTLIGDADDQGSTGNCSTISVNYPASDSNFVAAGGTALQLYVSNGDWFSENAWTGGTWTTNKGACANNDGGGGGGVSAVWPQPDWQSAYSSVSQWGSMRLEPDLSLNAGGTGQNYYYNGKLSGIGGTSIVAPELAGFFAQENSYLDYIGNICGATGRFACTPIGNPNPFIYNVGGAGAHKDPFYDITSGCTSNNVTLANDLTPWCAATGFDLATGWGSANMMQLAWGINFERIPAYGTININFTGPATGATAWYNTNQQVSWTITDTVPLKSPPAPGIAGFTQGWDTIPADPYSEPHGGTGNSFYSGPEYPFGTGGCLSFVAGGCAGGVSQGCHTVNVEAWDNEGGTATKTYGPLCYDTVAPNTSDFTNPATSSTEWVNQPVTVTLTPFDPGGSSASGISTSYYAINSTACSPASVSSCSVYTAPFTISGQQQSTVSFFAVDNAGNYSTVASQAISIDTTPPVTTATLSGTLSGGKYYSPVQVTLAGTDTGGSGYYVPYYELDGGGPQILPGGLLTVQTVGSHTLIYWGQDRATNVESEHTIGFTIAGFPSTMSTPASGAVLGTSSVPFTWTAGTGVTDYELWLGTSGPGSSSLYSSGVTSALTVTVPTIPAKGLTVYARLFSVIAGKSQYNDYTYTETVAGVPATMSSPTAGSTLGTSNVQFTWNAGTGVTSYELWLGTSGAGSSSLYSSGLTTSMTATVPSIPAKGLTVYARLFSTIAGKSQYNDYTYTEAVAGIPATMISPTSGSTLGTSNVQFSWTAGTGVTSYELWLGTSGPGSSSLYSSGATTALSATVPTLPAKGLTVYARLFSTIAGKSAYSDYTYTETLAGVPATMISPTAGSTLGTANVQFTWTAGTGVTSYELWLGTSGPGSSSLYSSGLTQSTSASVPAIQAKGLTVYARLFSTIGGKSQYNDYTYTEAASGAPATMISPTAGSTLGTSNVQFTWTAGTGVTNYELWLGTSGPGSSSLYSSGLTTLTSATVTTLPAKGLTVYARLFSTIGGKSQYNDYTYTEQ